MAERKGRHSVISPESGARVRFTRVGLDRRATAAATAGATLAANAFLLGVPGRLPTLSVTTGSRIVVTETHTPVTQRDRYLERWAKLYSKDPLAGETVRPFDAAQTVSQVENLLSQGVVVKDITVQGHASDENTVVKNGQFTAGLGVKSEKNLALANKRATVFEQMLREEFKRKGLVTPDIQLHAPQEDVLTHKEIGKFFRLARECNYGSIYDMIVSYNASLKKGAEHETTAIPEKVKKTLDTYLGNERYVEVTINGTLNGFDIKTNTEKRKIPYLFLVPIPILMANTSEVVVPGVVTQTIYQQGNERLSQGNYRIVRAHKQPRPYSEHPSARKKHKPRDHGGSLGRPKS